MNLLRTVVWVMAFALVVWAVGRALTVVSARTPPAGGARLYLAGRVDRLRIDAVAAHDDELLVSLASEVPNETDGTVLAGRG